MSSVRVRFETYEFGDVDIHVRSLRDTNEFEDTDGEAEKLGIYESRWPIFGVVWGSGRVLAELMADCSIDGRRILELGCGMALPSLVLNSRGADITASDIHPEVGKYLQFNTELNGGPDIPFERAAWEDDGGTLGRFDLIIGSDLLYDRDDGTDLSAFIERHAAPACEFTMTDAGRGEAGKFTTRMEALGFAHRKRPAPNADDDDNRRRVQIHSYARTGA